jgi:hypothetical protein
VMMISMNLKCGLAHPIKKKLKISLQLHNKLTRHRLFERYVDERSQSVGVLLGFHRLMGNR